MLSVDFILPESLIAITPSDCRTSAKMMVVTSSDSQVAHQTVSDLTDNLRAGDVMVINTTRVRRCRVLWAYRGQPQELVLLNNVESGTKTSLWQAIVSGKRLPIGQRLALVDSWWFELVERDQKFGTLTTVRLSGSSAAVEAWLEQVALPPLPPYIRKQRKLRGLSESWPQDVERYQTTYAAEGGAVAAPTAGLHLTSELLAQLKAQGVIVCPVRLDVGWGTFAPLTAEAYQLGVLHPEWVHIAASSAQILKQAQKEQRRVIAVGTTCVRALEWWCQQGASENGLTGWCDIFLRPPWRSNIISGMLTNFHLPNSSLALLVAGFLDANSSNNGIDRLIELYQMAITQCYRFYSYGDCMLIIDGHHD